MIDPSAFCPLDQFRQLVDETIAYMKSSIPAPGVAEVLVPGELEFRTLRQRQRTAFRWTTRRCKGCASTANAWESMSMASSFNPKPQASALTSDHLFPNAADWNQPQGDSPGSVRAKPGFHPAADTYCRRIAFINATLNKRPRSSRR